MPVDRIDHYAIRTDKLEETCAFYAKVVGLKEGHRPAFEFPGHWLYCGDAAVIHLIHFDNNLANEEQKGIMGDPEAFSDSGTGSVDHLAFRASDFEGFKKHLEALNIPIRETEVPDMDLRQLFLRDPNGVTIELNFWGTRE